MKKCMVHCLWLIAFCNSSQAAEFLIYDKDHWMDTATSQQMAKVSAEEYAARYQRGDVIEVRPDGYWTGPTKRGFNPNAFRVIALPNLSVEKAVEYMQESPTKRRRYAFTTGAGTKETILKRLQDITIVDKEIYGKELNYPALAGGALLIGALVTARRCCPNHTICRS